MQRLRSVRSGGGSARQDGRRDTPSPPPSPDTGDGGSPRSGTAAPEAALELVGVAAPALVAGEVRATRSLIGRLRASSVHVRQGATGVALGRDVTLNQGASWLLGGAKVDVQGSATQWIVGGLVQAKQVFAIAVVAGRIEGQVRCLFDARGAFAFGAGAALVTGLLRLFTRRREDRR
ncbi:MAG: hypothetical protein M3442_11620 [Chloroflexota bacterium]|nr:hypothetical protein [Chloroflexota bacterium]